MKFSSTILLVLINEDKLQDDVVTPWLLKRIRDCDRMVQDRECQTSLYLSSAAAAITRICAFYHLVHSIKLRTTINQISPQDLYGILYHRYTTFNKCN